MVSEPSLRREAVVAIAELSLRATRLAHEYTREEGATTLAHEYTREEGATREERRPASSSSLLARVAHLNGKAHGKESSARLRSDMVCSEAASHRTTTGGRDPAAPQMERLLPKWNGTIKNQ